ncbi:hypothetical protein GCM10025789_11330 [Tessaracoccus lubricantis]|uniref:Uncharacterized protein n=1 Tax=Tessaracoccus lubricantis TaxID=545543 RepID=A0ABP9F948_9ACTN
MDAILSARPLRIMRSSERVETLMNIEFGVGICKGGFFLPKKVNSNVEWGAWNDCNVYGSASTYVHSISAQLWMQTGAFAFQKTKQETAMSPLESVSSKVVTAHRVK